MSAYLTMMYITLDQEKVLKDLFLSKGWSYCKIDMSFLTDSIGPTIWNSASLTKKADPEPEAPDEVALNDVDTSPSTPSNDSDGDNGPLSVSTTEAQKVIEEANKSGEQVLDVTQKSYLCPKCGKCFQENQSFITHLAGHKMEVTGSKRQFVCEAEDCGKSFSRKSHWMFHMNIHEEKKPFVCEFCGNRYSSQYSHKRHILVCHTGDGGRCSMCGKTILEKQALIAHKSLCHAKSSHRCKVCGAVFKWKARLRRHFKKHEGTYMGDNRYDRSYIDYKASEVETTAIGSGILYQCENCLKKFKSQKCYESHLKASNCKKQENESESLHHKIVNYFCRDCNKTFKWKQSYYKHRKKQHCKDSMHLKTGVQPNKRIVENESSTPHVLKGMCEESSKVQGKSFVGKKASMQYTVHGKTSMKKESSMLDCRHSMGEEGNQMHVITSIQDDASLLEGGTSIRTESVLPAGVDGQEILVYYVREPDKSIAETDLVSLDDAGSMTITVDTFPDTENLLQASMKT